MTNLWLLSLFSTKRIAPHGDELGMVVRNKARLVDQGYSQVEGIDFGEGYDVDSSKFPLSNLPKVIEPVGFGWH